jgi:nucleoside-diphosphate-sugar epimerase
MRSRRTPAGRVVAVTGATGGLGGALLTRLAERAEAEGTAPPTGLAGLPAAAALQDALAGVHTVVHLAPGRDPAAPVERRRGDVEGTRALLDAARPAGVRRVVLLTSTDVHRARPGEVPLPETAPVRAPADGSLTGDWVETERLADHARRTGLDVVVLRPATLVGVGPADLGAAVRSLSGSRLLAVRGVEPLWQLCHAEDLVRALELAATGRLRGSAAVACEGWLRQEEVERLSGRRRLELPAAVVLSTAERLHRLGVSPGPPGELDALLAPVVVEPARLRAAGWHPEWTNEAALRAHLADTPAPGLAADRAAAYAAGTAGTTAAVLGTAALVRRARRRRRR